MAQNQNVQFNFIATDNVSQAAQRIGVSLGQLNLAAQGPAKIGLKQLADQFINLNAQIKLTDPEHKRLLANLAQIPKTAQAAAAGIMSWDAATKTMTVDFSKLGTASATSAGAINRALASSLNPLNQNITQFRTLLMLMNQLAAGGRTLTPNMITGLQGRLAPIIASGGASGIFGVNTGAGAAQAAISARTAQTFQNQQALQQQRHQNALDQIAARAAQNSSGSGRSGTGFQRLTPFGRSAYRTFTGIGVGIQAAQIGAGIGGGQSGGFNPIQLLFLMNAFERLPALAIPAAAAVVGLTAAVTALGKAALDSGGLQKYQLQLESILRMQGQTTSSAQAMSKQLSDQATALAKSTGQPLSDTRQGVATLQRGRLTGGLYQNAAAALSMEQGNTFQEAAKDLTDLVVSGGAKMEEFAAKYQITTQRIFGSARPTVAAFGDSVTLANKILATMGEGAQKQANTIPNLIERIKTSIQSLFETLGTPLQGIFGAGLGAFLDGLNQLESGLKAAFSDPGFQAFMKEGLQNFMAALKDAQPAFQSFGSALVGLIVTSIKQFITYAPVWIGIFKGLAIILTPVVQLFDFLAKLSILFAQGLKAIGDMLKPVLTFLKPFFDLLGALATFLKEFILDAAGRFVQWLKEVASHAQEAWDAFLSSPLGQWLQARMNDIENLANAVAGFWTAHGKEFWDFLGGLKDTAGHIISIVWEWAQEWGPKVWDFISKGADLVTKTVSLLFEAGKNILIEAWNWLFVDGDNAHLLRIVDILFQLSSSLSDLFSNTIAKWIGAPDMSLGQFLIYVAFTLFTGSEFKWIGDWLVNKFAVPVLTIAVEFTANNPLSKWVEDWIANSQGAIPSLVRQAGEAAQNTTTGGAFSQLGTAVNSVLPYTPKPSDTGAPDVNEFKPTAYRGGNDNTPTSITVNIYDGNFTDRESIRQTAKDVGDQINQNLRLRGPIQVSV